MTTNQTHLRCQARVPVCIGPFMSGFWSWGLCTHKTTVALLVYHCEANRARPCIDVVCLKVVWGTGPLDQHDFIHDLTLQINCIAPIHVPSPFTDTQLWNLISRYLNVGNTGGHPVCTALRCTALWSLGLLKNWITAIQSDSSRAGLCVWDALLNLGSHTQGVTTRWMRGKDKTRKSVSVNEKLFSWAGPQLPHTHSPHHLHCQPVSAEALPTWSPDYIWKLTCSIYDLNFWLCEHE